LSTELDPREFHALYLAVLPFYREECVRALIADPSLEVRLLAGYGHVDPTIRSGIDSSLYRRVHNVVVARKILLQFGGWRSVFSARGSVVDLNPRSLTAWGLLLVRRAVGRRTLVWGHLHPRAGASSKTAFLRRAMRMLANGTILYGYDSVPIARTELPGGAIWVAPNSLYRAVDMRTPVSDRPYSSVLYVGRLVQEKKVDLLIRGFLASRMRESGVKLVVVGEGSERSALEELASDLGAGSDVRFLGHISGVDDLKALYADAVCSVSPGYVGLSVTQSLGFGVPMVVSRDEPHAPEVELSRLGGVEFFETDSPSALAAALDSMPVSGAGCSRNALAAAVRKSYSAEAMAAGIVSALLNSPQNLGDDGWPTN